jgi:hypothetical protein
MADTQRSADLQDKRDRRRSLASQSWYRRSPLGRHLREASDHLLEMLWSEPLLQALDRDPEASMRFIPQPHHREPWGAKYCSNACMQKAARQRRRAVSG